MEHFQDDQLNSGRAHHQRAHQVISTPKPYSFDFPGVDGYRETSFHSQMHPVNYPTHLYPSVTGHFSIKEETDDSSDNRQQMGTKGVCLLSHSRVPPVGYNLNGEGHGMDGSIHHLQQDSLSSHGLPHHGYSSAVLHNSEHHEHSLNAYDGSNSSNFGLNSGLVSFMPGLPVEQNQHLSALAAVSSNRRFYDSQPIPSSSSLVPHFPNEYRNRDLEEERHGGSLKGPSVSCSPALDVLPPSCVQATCPSETGTPLSALNQLASVDDSRNHDPRRMFTNDPSSNQRAASHMGAEGGSGVVNRKRLSKRLSESGGDTGVAGGGGVPVGQNERTGGSEVGDLEDSAIQSAARVVERGRYECSICTTVCVDRQGFADHLFGFHLGIARFFCRFCDKKFYYRPKVYEHIREAHSKNVAGKKKKGVVPFLYQIEPDAKVKLMTFLKGRDGRDGATAVELHCLGSRVAGVRRQRGGKSTGKPKAVKPGGPKALFPCHWCDKEFTAQSYLDRHVKKGGCNRRRGKLRAATPVEHTGNGATHTPSPTNCSPSPTATPTPSPASSASQPSIRSPLSNSSSDGGSAGNSGFRQPFQPRGGPNTQQSVVADSGQRHAVSASTPYFQHFNHPHPPRQPGDDPESYVLLEL